MGILVDKGGKKEKPGEASPGKKEVTKGRIKGTENFYICTLFIACLLAVVAMLLL